MRRVSIDSMRAMLNASSVRMPHCEAVSEIAGIVLCCNARPRSDTETCSPVASRRSISRPPGSSDTACARATRSSVVFPIAERTTTRRGLWRRARVTRSAMARIRAALATEVPPYFCTTTGAAALIAPPR